MQQRQLVSCSRDCVLQDAAICMLAEHVPSALLLLLLVPQVYISGHGGNEFMKFQDTEELMAQVSGGGSISSSAVQCSAPAAARRLVARQGHQPPSLPHCHRLSVACSLTDAPCLLSPLFTPPPSLFTPPQKKHTQDVADAIAQMHVNTPPPLSISCQS
jgi:hypothetical protein